MTTKRPVSFNMPAEMLAAIDEAAAHEDRSRSQWLVLFLRRHGIKPHGVKDGPYDSEVTAAGTRVVDLPERYHVTIGFTDPARGIPWRCDELPDVHGVVDAAEDLHRTAVAAIKEHLGREAVAVYIMQ